MVEGFLGGPFCLFVLLTQVPNSFALISNLGFPSVLVGFQTDLFWGFLDFLNLSLFQDQILKQKQDSGVC
ncbi:hypothetical protein L1987_61626 [Smallanthus sonchifolius]|uniref:Uncharacterized protein n=1 Tax=Smallanthus sonchifolius TaxID=185202 RepID=A0ACB9C844_9ASTR|nr:hypothetical protein L1987_61626 [Smallanthus sonchifolius]